MASERPPHLLYVAWSYPPGRGGGVYRALATPNAFARVGWRVTVLTVERETFAYTTGGDPSLETQIHPSIRVERVPFSVPSYQVRVGDWSRWRARYPEMWNVWRARRDRGVFPEAVYGPWRPIIESAALRIHEHDAVDLTIATANPNVDFAAAFALHEKAGVPFIMDYRDAWQLDVFSGHRVSAPGGTIDRWERRMIAAAHEVWFVNEPIKRWHEDLYPAHAARMHVVANGFDADLTRFPSHVRAGRNGGPLTFGYIGTMSDQVPLPALLNGWRAARRNVPRLANARLELHGYLGHAGVPSDRWMRIIREHSPDAVTYHGPVAKTAIAETYGRFDALILVLGTGRYVTSGKVFEYCATGLPVVSVHDPGNAATDVLRGHPAWAPAPHLSTEAIADALSAGANLAATQTERSRSAIQDWASQFERHRQLEPRITKLWKEFA